MQCILVEQVSFPPGKRYSLVAESRTTGMSKLPIQTPATFPDPASHQTIPSDLQSRPPDLMPKSVHSYRGLLQLISHGLHQSFLLPVPPFKSINLLY